MMHKYIVVFVVVILFKSFFITGGSDYYPVSTADGSGDLDPPDANLESIIDAMAQAVALHVNRFIERYPRTPLLKKDDPSALGLCYAYVDPKWLRSVNKPGIIAIKKCYYQQSTNSVRFEADSVSILELTCPTKSYFMKDLESYVSSSRDKTQWTLLQPGKFGFNDFSVAVIPSRDIYLLNRYGERRVASMYPVIETLALRKYKKKFVLGLWKNVKISVGIRTEKKNTELNALWLKIFEKFDTKKKTARRSRTPALKKFFKGLNCLNCVSPKTRNTEQAVESLVMKPSTSADTSSEAATAEKMSPGFTSFLCADCSKRKDVFNIVNNAAHLAQYSSGLMTLPFRRRTGILSTIARKFKKRRETADYHSVFFFWLRRCPKLYALREDKEPTKEGYDLLDTYAKLETPVYLHQVTFGNKLLWLVLYTASVVSKPECLNYIDHGMVFLTNVPKQCNDNIFVISSVVRTPYPVSLEGKTLNPTYFPRVTSRGSGKYNKVLQFLDQPCPSDFRERLSNVYTSLFKRPVKV